MKRPVELPSGDLLPLREFASAIVESILPMRLDDIKGIECIFGLERTYGLGLGKKDSLPIFSFVDFGYQQHVRDLVSSEKRTAKLKLPYTFSALRPESLAKEREVLEALLLDLPPLKYPLSDRMISDFMAAFNEHKDRPDWKPLFLTARGLERRRQEYDTLINECFQEIVAAAQDGQIVIIDPRQHCVSSQSIGRNFDDLFIRRDNALIFLEAIRRQVAPTNDQGEVTEITTDKGVRVWREGKSGKWPPEELEALYNFLETIDQETGEKKYTQALAAKLVGLSEGAISTQYNKYKDKLAKQKADSSMKAQATRGSGLKRPEDIPIKPK